MNKKNIFWGVCLAVVAGVTTVSFVFHFSSEKHFYTPRHSSQNNIPQGANGYINYLKTIRANQQTGTVDYNDVMNAYNQADKLAVFNKKNSQDGLQWTEVGPDNIGGRTRAILFDKNNTNTIYAGSVSGGLWISKNGGASWDKYNDMLENLAVSCITQAVNGDIYFGTGEGFYSPTGEGAAGIMGKGIWKKSAGESEFKRLTSTANSNFMLIYNIASDPNNSQQLYAATGSGFYITDDGGQKWFKPKQSNGITIPGNAFDVDVAYDGTVIAFIGSSLYKSDNGKDGTYKKIPGIGSGGRHEFTISPSNSSYMYCSAATGDGFLKNIYQSKDKGETWTVIGPGGSNTFEPFASGRQGQGEYDNAIAVDPANPERIFLGGVTFWSWSNKEGWKKAGSDFDDKRTPSFYIHADKHTIVFHPQNPNVCLIGSDGGIFKSDNMGTREPTFKPINKGYGVTQFYSVAFSGDESETTGDIIGGTQDNGTQYINKKGNTTFSSKLINGGDGIMSGISVINPNAFFASVYSGNIRRSSNKGSSFSAFYDEKIDCDSAWDDNNKQWYCKPNGLPDDSADFLTSFALWESVNDVNSADSLTFTATPVTESIGNGNGTQITFSGTLAPEQKAAKVIPGSLTIKADNLIVKDDGNGKLTGNVATTGTNTIDYKTGAYTLTFSTAPSYSSLIKAYYDVSYNAGDVLKIKSKTSDFPFLYKLTQSVNPKDTIKIQDVVQSKFATSIGVYGGVVGDKQRPVFVRVWLTKEALNFSKTPVWFKIADTLFGTVHTMAFSKDGNHLFVGTNKGKDGKSYLYRISGLNSISSTQDVSGKKYNLSSVSGTGQVQQSIVASFFFQTITGVNVDKNNPEHVVVTLGNYGNSSYVWQSVNALDSTPVFTSIQGNLPFFPVYDVVIESTASPARIIVATDLGIWMTKDNGKTWTEQNNGMARVATFMLSQQTNDKEWNEATGKYPVTNHGVLYAATHGRGIFRSKDFLVVGTDKKNIVNSESLKPGISSVYPNPVNNQPVITFNLAESANVSLSIYNLHGKLLRSIDLPNQTSGLNKVTYNTEELPAGVYFVHLRGEKISSSAKFIVVK